MKALASLALLASLGSAASAQTIFSTGFDAPTYTTGSVSGQDGWTIGNGTANTGFQSVSTAAAFAGGQGLAFDNSTITSNASVRRAFAGTTGTAYTATTKLRIGAANNPSRLYGLYLSTSTFNTTYFAANIGGDGGIRVGKTWGELYKATPNAIAPAGTFANRWLDLTLTLDGAGNGAIAFSGFGDGAVYNYSFTGVANTTGTKYLLLGADYVGAASTATGTASFDNVSLVTPSAVPEPTTMAALGLGALALIKRRRKSA